MPARVTVPVIAVEATGNDLTLRHLDRALTAAGMPPFRKTVTPRTGKVRVLLRYPPGTGDEDEGGGGYARLGYRQTVGEVLAGIPGPVAGEISVSEIMAAPPLPAEAREPLRWRGDGLRKPNRPAPAARPGGRRRRLDRLTSDPLDTEDGDS